MRLALAASALALTFAAPSYAATYKYDYTGTDQTGAAVSVQGWLSTSDTLNSFGGFDVLSIVGSANGQSITGITPDTFDDPSQLPFYSSKYYTFDNTLYPTAAKALSTAGLAFSGTDSLYNLFADGVSGYVLYAYNPTTEGLDYSTGSLQLTSTPEPETWALMITGMGFVGFAMRRKFNRHKGVAAIA